MPWFVSDSLQKDVFWTLDCLQEHPLAALSQLGTALREHIDEKRILVTDHVFYTLPYEFSKMTRVCPDLYTELQKSYLIILKGDLNYRKLVADRRWPHTTSFRTGLSGFEPSAVCTLRTLKAETVVGLPEGCAEKVAEQDENWLHNGKYGVVQLLASPGSAWQLQHKLLIEFNLISTSECTGKHTLSNNNSASICVGQLVMVEGNLNSSLTTT